MVAPANVPVTCTERSARSVRWSGCPMSPAAASGVQVVTTASTPPAGPRILEKVGTIVAIGGPPNQGAKGGIRRPASGALWGGIEVVALGPGYKGPAPVLS